MKRLESEEMFDLRIIATGMHLSPEFGLTYREIEEDGFAIHEKVEMILSSDTETGIAKFIGIGILIHRIIAVNKANSDAVRKIKDVLPNIYRSLIQERRPSGRTSRFNPYIK